MSGRHYNLHCRTRTIWWKIIAERKANQIWVMWNFWQVSPWLYVPTVFLPTKDNSLFKPCDLTSFVLFFKNTKAFQLDTKFHKIFSLRTPHNWVTISTFCLSFFVLFLYVLLLGIELMTLLFSSCIYVFKIRLVRSCKIVQRVPVYPSPSFPQG